MAETMARLGVQLLLVFLVGCKATAPLKVNGVSFVASHEAVSQAHIGPVLDVHASYASVMPYGFIPEPETPEIIFNTDRQMFGETKAGAKQYIDQLHANGIRVMLKPQLWVWRGVFTGNLEMKSEEDWQLLEENYSNFILAYADLAAETEVDLFCIGTELRTFVKERPEYWSELIRRIRSRFSGNLTYAANWDEYGSVPFWDDLDYIGIDAYFPLSDQRTPSVASLLEAWIPWKTEIQELASRFKIPVLFTEYGYRSVDHTARRPWEADRIPGKVNLEAQVNANRAIFETFWKEPWFAGGFVWKWFINHPVSGGSSDNRFTPQNKPAEQVLRSYYRSGKF